MCIAIALTCALMVTFVPFPAEASWGYVAVSALLHAGHNLFLVRTYRQGDLGQTYPIAEAPRRCWSRSAPQSSHRSFPTRSA